MGLHMTQMLHSCDDAWDSELFYHRAGLIDLSETGNDDGSDDDVDKPRDPAPGRCVLDLGEDYGFIGGANRAAPPIVLVAMVIICISAGINSWF
jgi:hypothetical protein